MKDEKFEMSWEDAIRTVLAEKGEPMHYREITEKIIENGYRINYGDTPEMSVGTILRLNDNLFRRVGLGIYELVETSVTLAVGRTVGRVVPVVVMPCSLYSRGDSKYKHASDFINSLDLLSLAYTASKEPVLFKTIKPDKTNDTSFLFI
jgi:hypothetical protein